MIDNFMNALACAGLMPKTPIIADGVMRRFRVDGDKAGSRNGWYVLYGDTLPAGAYGCWKRGVSYTWCAKGKNKLTTAEKRDFAERMTVIKNQRRAELEQRRTKARFEAESIWSKSAPCFDHPYLTRKRVKPYNLRHDGGALILPLMDTRGVIHSIQRIYANGDKRFLSGGRIKGCYCPIGGVGESLVICEGYSTGASLRESTGHNIAVAFNAGNLMPVAQALRAKYPAREIIIAADNDDHLDENIGVIKASDAARAIDASIIIPPISGDFNDYYNGVQNNE